MSGNGGDRIEACFPADDDAPGLALAAARRFAMRAGLEPADANRLAIIVEELVCNIVEHGAPPPGSTITLEFARDTSTLRLTIIDEAAPFDPGAASTPDAVPERGGGAGLALVRRWARIERYERVFGVNRLVLAMPLDPSGQ